MNESTTPLLESWSLDNNILLSGTFPNGMLGIRPLQKITIGSSRMSGVLPTNASYRSESLKLLNFAQMRISGQFPHLIAPVMSYISFRDNRLSGFLPSSIMLLTSMRHMFGFGNSISGSINTEMSSLTGLQNLVMSSTRLSGSGLLLSRLTGGGRLFPGFLCQDRGVEGVRPEQLLSGRRFTEHPRNLTAHTPPSGQ